MATYYTIRKEDGKEGALAFDLSGAWTVGALSEIDDDFSGDCFADARRVSFDGRGLADFDTSAAWYLNDLVIRLKGRGVEAAVGNLSDHHRLIFERVSNLPQEKEERREEPGPLHQALKNIGAEAVELTNEMTQGVSFFGEFAAFLPRILLSAKNLRFRSIIFHINEVGIKALPIISLMAFSISLVTGYQGAFQLGKFGAKIFTIDLITISTLREMGVLLTAIMLAGRSGSAFAAQLGTMKLNEEVDALKTMGVSPFTVLVMPRVLAILIALPLLTLVADGMGLMGGYVFSKMFLGYSYVQFLGRMQQAADLAQLGVGMLKAPFFAVIIGIVGCMQGLSVRGSAEEVGRRTTAAVVQSIFLVIIADALFSILFTRLGI
ncbi:MAG: MlaE family lipid ABC transporter permease subunit [Alphaproteobacteria bacterium]|nr:MlaE family lipid ABC transporter permease subunit [Alphaproteobacteria bacterium]